MNPYFAPEGLVASYNAPSMHKGAQFVVHPSILRPSQYPDSITFWHNPHQQRISHPQGNHSRLQMASIQNDQRKHKRTRSGCFTCRSRRVKCDETHPICDRCSKGKRDCVYPSPPVRKSGSRANLDAAEKPPVIPESESSDENDGRDTAISKTNPTEQNEGTKENISLSPTILRQKGTMFRRKSVQSLSRRKLRQPSDTSSNIQEKGSSPGIDIASGTAESRSPGGNIETGPETLEPVLEAISNLPVTSNLKYDIRFFLEYHRQQITFEHYCLRQPAEAFIKNDLLASALQYEPLLYAVVGYSAYHYSIRHPKGKLYTFLKYYNQSVTGLLKSLSSGNVHNDAMLLTILQLATFEEYLGDWASVIDHHQAAHRMLTELYTPEKIYQNEFRRHIFMWYTRFDVVSGLIAGNETILDRDWYIACEFSATGDAANNPGDLNKQYLAWGVRNRRIAMDMASLIAKASRGVITTEEFNRQNKELSSSIEEIQQNWNSLTNPQHLVMSYPNKVPLGPDDIVDPYVPGGIHNESQWEMNNCLVDVLSTIMMHKYQTGVFLQQLDLAELQSLALEICRVVEAMERWPNRPKDSMLSIHNALGLSTLFLPRDEQHTMWCRRKLAQVEQLGLIHPPAFRTKMADFWQLPELTHWWLPNDEGYPRLVREIRDWIRERELKPRDTFREDVCDLKTMFWRMNLDDTGSTNESSPKAPSSISGVLPYQSPP
ncbi:hypothetical protein PAAG_12589 [Paracoccidioides lutzii Pb01]|uniref:Zn(2)-C6 fungal-type domain-containing protein n=1 Tax=Paracoccidioides lutzii (strain ATCC MYA-826 / Pb01) TaxID=502779 RepID=A0A0A2UYV8_PARBA|nr:hypothetical protein PAAG_12589 [Paracoccidioides lutzii Pb01]KGQ00746.1 hypothetical protein PAAG_12589 [Paracoccidioides lutzii Pb01]